MLRERGLDVVRFELDRADDVAAARAAADVVAGGDGSIGPAAEAAASARVPLGVVPVGTANDFARALGLPDDPAAAVELAATGRRRAASTSAGSARRPFVNAASAGLSPVAARKAHGLKAALGPLAYTVGALRAGLFAQPVAARVAVDGSDRLRRPRLAGDRRRSPGRSAAAPRSTPTRPTGGSTWSRSRPLARSPRPARLRAALGRGRGAARRGHRRRGADRGRDRLRRRASTSTASSSTSARLAFTAEPRRLRGRGRPMSARPATAHRARPAALGASRAGLAPRAAAATGRSGSPAPGRSAGTRPTASATAARAPSATRSDRDRRRLGGVPARRRGAHRARRSRRATTPSC